MALVVIMAVPAPARFTCFPRAITTAPALQADLRHPMGSDVTPITALTVEGEANHAAIANVLLLRSHVCYRAEHRLSQTALARLLGWRQPAVARLKAAEHNPSMDTLLTLARKLGLQVHVDVGPKTGVVARVIKSREA